MAYYDDIDTVKDPLDYTPAVISKLEVMPDYTYRPSKYRALKNQVVDPITKRVIYEDLSVSEYDEIDLWASELYANVQPEMGSKYNPNLTRELRGQDVDQVLKLPGSGDNNAVRGRIQNYLVDFDLTDIADFDSHLRSKEGYMLAIFALVADRITVKGLSTYLDLDVYPLTESEQVIIANQMHNEDSYHSTSYRFRVTTHHLMMFYYHYSGGVRKGISALVRGALYVGLNVKFDHLMWLSACRDDWRKQTNFESGQLKIFLSSMRAFDNLPPGHITVLVIGSGSHPVKSGYTYHAMANFLTLSGFSGLIHLFDPLENHLSCRIGNFDLVYYSQAYVIGGTYLMKAGDGLMKCPTVILDDLFTGENEILQDLDPRLLLVTSHRTSRVCTKYFSSIDDNTAKKQLGKCGVRASYSRQYAYEGSEMRAYYRVPTSQIVTIGQWVGNMQCAKCWAYAGLISRIGRPQEDLGPYWRLMYSISGHHCSAVSGIRNIMVLSALKHELTRGHTKSNAIMNVVDNVKGLKFEKVKMLYEFAEKCDSEYIQVEQHYPPNYDLGMTIRDRVSVPHIVDMLTDHAIGFIIHPSEDYPLRKLTQINELYAEVLNTYYTPLDIVLYTGDYVGSTDDIILVENVKDVSWDAYDIVYQLGNSAIMVQIEVSVGVRMLFDRGRAYDLDDAYQEY